MISISKKGKKIPPIYNYTIIIIITYINYATLQLGTYA
jgi:hypothetical protein